MKRRLIRWYYGRFVCRRHGHALATRKHYLGRGKLSGRVLHITRCARCGFTAESQLRRPMVVPRSRRAVA